MAIYRGLGGSGEADNDATTNLVTEKAMEAAASAAAALVSEINADASAIAADVAKIEWQGEYNAGTTYAVNDAVFYTTTGSSYINIQASTGQAPADGGTVYWDELAVKGGISGIGTGDLLSTLNLSDLGDIPTAVANLGLTIGTDVLAQPASVTLANMLVSDGTNYVGVPISGDATIASDGTMTVNAGAANTVILTAKVNEAAGIAKGQVVYISGATGGFPQVSIATNADFAKADVLAIATEAKADNQNIIITTQGLLENIDTTAFTEGAILYLGAAGAITATHPSGIIPVQRLGHAAKINAVTGSIIVELDALTVINDHNGTMRQQIVNQNAGAFASTTYTMVNDASHRSSLSYLGSGWGAGNEHLGVYNEGYGKTIFTVDGNHGFEWNTDVTDSHNFSNTTKMSLSAAGELAVTGAIDVVHTAAQTDDHALEIDANAAGFGDVKAIDVVYLTGAIATGEDEGVILVNIDETLATGGTVAALEVLSTSIGSATVDGMLTGVNVNPVKQLSGTFGNADTILNIAVDVTAALAIGGAGNITMFAADNDTITIGDAAKFEEIEVIIDTGSSQRINPTFEYSTGVGTWAAFTPVDGTNGFRNTGEVLWLNGDIPSWVVGTGSEYLIRITRTRNNITTPPIVDTIQVAEVTEYTWDKDGALTVASINGLTTTDILVANATDNLSVGITTDVEVLASDTITPDLALESLKTRSVVGNVTINVPSNGNGKCAIRLDIDGTDRTVTLGTNVLAVGTIPTLTASATFIAVVTRFSATSATVQIKEAV